MSVDWCDIDAAIWDAVTTKTKYTSRRKESLHSAVEQLGLTSWAEAVVHGMIDTGRVTAIECEMPRCLMPYRSFDKSNGRRAPGGLSIDHVQMRHQNGSHRLDNLRLAHYKCNCAWTTGTKRPAEVGAKIGAKVRGQKRTEEQRARLREARALVARNLLVCEFCGKTCRGGTGLASHQRRSKTCGGTHNE